MCNVSVQEHIVVYNRVRVHLCIGSVHFMILEREANCCSKCFPDLWYPSCLPKSDSPKITQIADIHTVVASLMASSGCSSLESDEGSPERRPNSGKSVPGTRHLEEYRKILSLGYNLFQNGCCR